MHVINKFAASVALATAVVASQAQATTLIVNGGFETGDFSGWTANAVSFPMYIVTSPVHSGTYAAQIAGFSLAPDTLSQTVSDTAGQAYDLSFSRFIGDGDPTVSMTVTWGGATIFSELNPGAANSNVYQTFSFGVVGTGSDTLVFTTANDPSFTYLDDVSLTATPLPPTWTMLIAGFVGLGFFAYRGTKKNGTPSAAA
jgi:hypothetical protein